MNTFFIFALFWWILGSPFIGFLLLLFIIYWVDRRFIGLFPNILSPLKRRRRLKRLQTELSLNPHNQSSKLEAARILIEIKQYAKAKQYLEQMISVMEDSAEVVYEKGFCDLKLGNLEAGEEQILKALEMNPRVRYGEPYLRLGEALAKRNTDRAIHYLEQFKQVHNSSSEAYFRLGLLYEQLEQVEEAKKAYREAVDIYRSLPKYKRKSERKWALLAGLKR